MINFNYETVFSLPNEAELATWISKVIAEENHQLDGINYIFCDDDYLHKLNVEFLNHDTLTDVISFDYSVGNTVSGDIFISIERVTDNAKEFSVSFEDELRRIIVHGVLHFCGYKDKSEADERLMRNKEDYYLSQFS